MRSDELVRCAKHSRSAMPDRCCCSTALALKGTCHECHKSVRTVRLRSIILEVNAAVHLVCTAQVAKLGSSFRERVGPAETLGPRQISAPSMTFRHPGQNNKHRFWTGDTTTSCSFLKKYPSASCSEPKGPAKRLCRTVQCLWTWPLLAYVSRRGKVLSLWRVRRKAFPLLLLPSSSAAAATAAAAAPAPAPGYCYCYCCDYYDVVAVVGIAAVAGQVTVSC